MLHSAIEKTKIPEDDSPTYNAVELTKNGNVARIILENHVYTLRITRSGKLILTKQSAVISLIYSNYMVFSIQQESIGLWN